MVDRFFSRERTSESKSVEGLDEEHFGIYHRFIIAYPAYTVERIEIELSWRQVRLLMEQWEKEPPVSVAIARVEKMLEAKFGFSTVPMKLQTTHSEVMNVISQTGMSA